MVRTFHRAGTEKGLTRGIPVLGCVYVVFTIQS